MIPGAKPRHVMTRTTGRVHVESGACAAHAHGNGSGCVPVVVVDPTDVEQARRILGRLYGADPDRIAPVNVAAFMGAMADEAAKS